jgi:hypothetical protein
MTAAKLDTTREKVHDPSGCSRLLAVEPVRLVLPGGRESLARATPDPVEEFDPRIGNAQRSCGWLRFMHASLACRARGPATTDLDE